MSRMPRASSDSSLQLKPTASRRLCMPRSGRSAGLPSHRAGILSQLSTPTRPWAWRNALQNNNRAAHLRFRALRTLPGTELGSSAALAPSHKNPVLAAARRPVAPAPLLLTVERRGAVQPYLSVHTRVCSRSDEGRTSVRSSAGCWLAAACVPSVRCAPVVQPGLPSH